MDLHEYQSKSLMRRFGLPVSRGVLCYTPAEVEAAYDRLGSKTCAVKAQVHAGGRGKAGGVIIGSGANELRSAAERILGMTLVTAQSGPAGKLVRKVYVEEGCEIDREFYLSLLIDRVRGCISVVASSEGGMEVEEIAKGHPERILKIEINPELGLLHFQPVELAEKLNLRRDLCSEFSDLLFNLSSFFECYDLSLLEINPLVLTKDGHFVILDAKCSVDDNALFRQDELRAFADYDETDRREIEAHRAGLNYISLDGNIGCMVNGAGLAMATMDIIKLFGGMPANFLDVGGGATKEMVCSGFEILISDPAVSAILVNIFGGIMRCDVIAEGIVAAARKLSIKVPLIVRLQGTNVELGKKILSESGLSIISAEHMADAAAKAVQAASGRGSC